MPRFGWFVGHLTLLFTALRYGISYITFHSYSRWARFSYRTAFIAAAVTYGIVVYKAYRARARAVTRQPGGALAVAGDENVQYLGMATSAFIGACFCMRKHGSLANLPLVFVLKFVSDGHCVAVFPANPTGPSSIHGLLHFSRCNIHPH